MRNASIDIYQVGTALRDLSLDARFDTQTLDLTGQSRVGSGMARFNGKLSWRDSEPYGDLHVEGDRLRIVDVPEARIDASPKLDFKLSGRHVNVDRRGADPQGTAGDRRTSPTPCSPPTTRCWWARRRWIRNCAGA